jgi:hypothetical protein
MRAACPPLSWPLPVPHHDGAGVVDAVGEHRFPLEAVADAHEAVERGVLGKVLVELTYRACSKTNPRTAQSDMGAHLGTTHPASRRL